MYMEVLKSHKLKVTYPRTMILKILEEAQEPMTAQDIYFRFPSSKKITLSTIYRNLRKLSEAHILTKAAELDNRVYYEYLLKDNAHKHYLLCNQCSEIITLPECPVEDIMTSITNETGYRIQSHTVEFRGICPTCQEKSK